MKKATKIAVIAGGAIAAGAIAWWYVNQQKKLPGVTQLIRTEEMKAQLKNQLKNQVSTPAFKFIKP